MTSTLRPRWSMELPGQFGPVGRDMDQMFDHLFGKGNGHQASPLFAPASLWEEEDRWCIEFDLPGVRQDDIDVTVEKNSLRLTAGRRAPQEDRKYTHQERAYGQIQRAITLPETIDSERIEAGLKDGVLTVYLAKKPELQPKKIQVKAN
jgi:HSP20 family protein